MCQRSNNESVNFFRPMCVPVFVSYVAPGTFVVTHGADRWFDPGVVANIPLTSGPDQGVWGSRASIRRERPHCMTGA